VFRKQVNPKVAAIATLVTLVAIQWVYWRALVFKPNSPRAGMLMGGGMPSPIPVALGMDSVPVENWAGEEPGYADGPAWAARFAGPNALAEEADGSLLVADSRNHRLRRIAPNGRVSTLAGSGADGVGGAAVGPAASARFRYPSGVAVSGDGTVFISDTGNHRICRLKAGQVEVFAGGASGSADGIGSTAKFNHPGALAFDRAGVLWVWDNGNRRLRRIGGEGGVSTPAAIPAEITATLGMVSRSAPEIVSSAAEGRGPITASPYKSGVRSGAALLPSGTQVFGDLTHHVVYLQRRGEGPVLVAGRIQAGVTGISDKEGTGLRSNFATPAAVLARRDGSVFVADYDGNRIRRLRLPTALIQ
jgi:DNA-binding beta-propeller fold protein YncE